MRASRLALGIEAIGLILLIACSYVDTPFVTHKVGQAGRIEWGPRAPVPDDLVPCGCYFVEVAGASAYDFEFKGPVKPTGPGPSRGQAIDVSYLDTVRGWTILAVTTDTGHADALTYTTPDYDLYLRNVGFAYAALVGLVVGIILVLAGAILLRRAVPTAQAGTLSTSLALGSVIGLAPIVGAAATLPGSTWTYGLFSLAWIATATTGFGFAVASRTRREQPRTFATFGFATSIAVTVLGLVAWLSIAVRILSAP
jgi:hypothetical protein